jgi:hypothetical protein
MAKKRGIGLEKNEKGQSPVSPLSQDSKKRILKWLGFILFVVGAFVIVDAVFSITGYATSSNQFTKDNAAIIGLALEILGVILMSVKFKD